MPRPASAQPTEVEMQMLRILWELGPSPVREIHKRLEAAKGTNYSTTVKMLAVMLQKGLVKRDEEAQPHVYRPAITRAKTGKRMLDDLIEKVYDGSAMSLVLQALSSGKATKEELDQVRRMLDQMEGQIAMLGLLTQSLAQSSLADRIGWVLVHSLWQFALVALLAAVLQWALQRRSATTRYGALLAAMFVMVAVPVATWFSPWSVDAPVVAAKSGPVEQPESISPQGATGSASAVSPKDIQHPDKSIPSTGGASGTPSVPQPEPRHLTPAPLGLAAWLSLVQRRVQAWLPEIVLVWLAGVLVAALRLLLSWYTVRRLRTVGVSPAGDMVHKVLERTAKRLRLARAVEVLQSTLVKTPVVVGYFRPAVLLPLCVVTGLPEAQLELILAHELAHIRRHDYLVNLLQTLVETLFFYHPAVWWLSHQIRNERENCCDDVAMATVGSRADYGRALLAIEELRASSPALSLASHGGSLLARIRRIAGCEPAPRIAGGGSILCVILISIAIFAAVTWAAAPSAKKPEQTPPATATNVVAEANDQPPALLAAFGKVVDPAGKPVGGATVYLREWSTYRISSDPYNESPQDVLATAHTDADGAFRFEKVAAKSFLTDEWFRQNPWDIVVAAKSYGLAWRHMRTSHPMQAFEIIRLQAATAISGRVTDRAARPIKGAEVRVCGIDPLGQELRYDYAAPGTLDLHASQLRPLARTDGDGRFELDGLPRDALLTVVVTHDNFDREFLHVATSNEPQPDLPITPRTDAKMAQIHPANFTVELGLAPPRITGQVVATDTGQPIAGARVEGMSNSRWSYATADDQGHFLLRYVMGSECRVRAEGPHDSPYLGLITLVDMPKTQAEVSMKINLIHGEPLRGTVVAADTGQGVPGVRVAFDTGLDWNKPRDGALLPSRGSKTDAAGRFQLVVPASKGKVVISGPAPGFDLPRHSGRPEDLAPQFAKEVEVVRGWATPEVKFALRREGSPIPPGKGVITGRVVDLAGKPLAGVEVAPSFWFRVPGEGQPVPTDQDGRFWLRLTRQLPEEFIIAIDRQRRLRGHAPLPKTAPSQQQQTSLEIRLAPTGTITGRVMEDDKPIVGAQIQADELEPVKGDPTASLKVNDRYCAKTDDNGRFEIPMVEAGHRLLLHPYIEGYADAKFGDVTAVASAGQTVEVKPFLMIATNKIVSGVVVDPDGNPVAGVTVSAEMRSGGQIPGAFTHGSTGKDGRFTIRGVPNVPLMLTAYVRPPDNAKDRRIRNSARVYAEPGQSDLRIVLDPKLARGNQ